MISLALGATMLCLSPQTEAQSTKGVGTVRAVPSGVKAQSSKGVGSVRSKPSVATTQSTKGVGYVRGTQLRVGRPNLFSSLKGGRLSTDERIQLPSKYRVDKPKQVDDYKGLESDRVIVKFVDGARVRAANPQDLSTHSSDPQVLRRRLGLLAPQFDKIDPYDRFLLEERGISAKELEAGMKRVLNVLDRHPLQHWGKVFGDIGDENLELLRRNAEVTRKQKSADLANYYWFKLQKGHRAADLANLLNQEAIVELAYLPPIPQDADVPPATPSFQGSQGYLEPAPQGIDAEYAWTRNGGQGNLIRIVDIESGWNLNHEDLPSMFLEDGRIDDEGQHGTAVMGVMLGLDDGTGITGIVPEASGGVVSVARNLGINYYFNVAEAVLVAAMNLSPGDVILIEQHSRGPGNDGDCTQCITDDGRPRSQCGYVAMEYWNDIFDAINAASASGIIVAQAAGNGEMNLDHSRYNNRFDRFYRDSGALFVGGGTSDDHSAKCWSNFGDRLDVQGWGENVMTTGYGTPTSDTSLQVNGLDQNQWYTSGFSGTSSATPVVAGAVAAIQGVQFANNNRMLNWYEMRDLLSRTGTPQSGSNRIGPLPDLRAAIDELAPPTPEDAVYETTIVMGDEDETTEVSGYDGSRTNVVGDSSIPFAIDRLRLGERSDRPCFMQVEKAHAFDNVASSPHDSLDLCGNNGPTNSSLVFVPTITPNHDTFIRGVSVCSSRTNNSTRLKGVKLFRTRVEDDGRLTPISNPTTFDRPNCDDDWHDPAMCPAGQVATQLLVESRLDGNNRVFTGLSLRCREITSERECVSGCGTVSLGQKGPGTLRPRIN